MAGEDRLTQFDKALLGLRSLVMSGEFEVSARLPEVSLSERLGISRTPLRQAMDRLVSEGLLERIDTGGCRVASFTIEDITDAIEIRGVIEGTAARLAAERGADPGLLAEADRVLEQIDAALDAPGGADFDAYVRLNARFHDLLARLAGSAVIRREAERVARLPLASPSSFLQGQELYPDFQASLVRAQRHHRLILSAIRGREGARAEALAREHARLARENLEYLTKTEPSLATRVPGFALVSDG
ncbi:GntR family transcriptional regulator [Seohaeicola saemankumensis]|nr:GntR family transcriptional regulator [Seohaeicola saemankumensis]MCA0873788.1 GntR family transcriptional regulator [Seohaeicola saemankumensis]